MPSPDGRRAAVLVTSRSMCGLRRSFSGSKPGLRSPEGDSGPHGPLGPVAVSQPVQIRRGSFYAEASIGSVIVARSPRPCRFSSMSSPPCA